MLWLLLIAGVNVRADEACPAPAVLLDTLDVETLARLLGERGRIHIPLCAAGFVEVAATGKPLCRAGKLAEVTRIGIQIRAGIDQAFGVGFIVRKKSSPQELATDVVGEKLVEAQKPSLPPSLRRFIELESSVGLFQTVDNRLIVNAQPTSIDPTTLILQIFDLASAWRQDAPFAACAVEAGYFR
ncbi:hypothetical protein ABIC94_005208 [Variovorax paradoxus]|uniref:hypothetical protein n=1 Tax=Variovorax paradoxus TaxID=34073 RepID=UPI0033967775